MSGAATPAEVPAQKGVKSKHAGDQQGRERDGREKGGKERDGRERVGGGGRGWGEDKKRRQRTKMKNRQYL